MGSSCGDGATLEASTAERNVPPSAEKKKKKSRERERGQTIVFLCNTSDYLEIVLTFGHNLLCNDCK